MPWCAWYELGRYAYPLVDGQGNFVQWMVTVLQLCYTEARLNKIAEETLLDIEKETVNFQNNFDDSLCKSQQSYQHVFLILLNKFVRRNRCGNGFHSTCRRIILADTVDATIAYINNRVSLKLTIWLKSSRL